jgi:hypothetical protein
MHVYNKNNYENNREIKLEKVKEYQQKKRIEKAKNGIIKRGRPSKYENLIETLEKYEN